MGTDTITDTINENNPKQSIVLFTTGGTIDKTYDEIEGHLSNRESVIRQKILSRLRLPYTEFEIRDILALDSLYMEDRDREKIYQEVRIALKEKKPILILHGTDTMELTAQYVWERLKKGAHFSSLLQPIIFTGAMRPVGFDDSDAIQNFTEAATACHLASPNVYISFHGRLFEVPYVTKNKYKGTFTFKDYKG